VRYGPIGRELCLSALGAYLRATSEALSPREGGLGPPRANKVDSPSGSRLLLGRRQRRYPSLEAFANLAAPTEAKQPAGSTLHPLRCKTKAYDEVAHVPRPHQTRRPTWNSAHCNRPRMAKCITGLICNGFSVMTVCNPTLWEYSGDSLGA
jgi:hypothetical protein